VTTHLGVKLSGYLAVFGVESVVELGLFYNFPRVLYPLGNIGRVDWKWDRFAVLLDLYLLTRRAIFRSVAVGNEDEISMSKSDLADTHIGYLDQFLGISFGSWRVGESEGVGINGGRELGK